MYNAVFILLFVARVSTERRSVQQSVFVSRKSRSNSMPTETGYVYSQVNDHPGTLAMFGTDTSDYNSHSLGHYSDYPSSATPTYIYKTSAPTTYTSYVDMPISADISPYTPSPPMPSYEFLKAKSEAKYESKYLPSKIKSDLMYEKLKSLMHYKYPDDAPIYDSNYDTLSDYHIDDDDVRTSSRSTIDGWPYFYHSPSYDYEAMKDDSKETAKDKRFIANNHKDIIPVHEHIDEVPHYYNQPLSTTRYDRQVTTDNPIHGNQPFFSYVLNDYSNKDSDEDPLVFKGLDWDKGYDYKPSLSDIDDDLKRTRRLGNNNYSHNYANTNNGNLNTKLNQNYDSSKVVAADSTTEKGYHKNKKFDKHEKGDKHDENHKTAYENAGNNYRGYKDFVDTFANKFGHEDHKKDAKYLLKKNQDKGEKRKGFRRVYHKDEYQEEDEFYDNSNSTAKAEEKGGSAVHHGGSEAALQSHAVAAIGNEANAYNNAGNTAKNKFENNHSGNEMSAGFDNNFNRHRDLVKNAGQSDGSNYVHNYRY